ncbi:MAG: GTPase HflX [Zestosphaera sp.]
MVRRALLISREADMSEAISLAETLHLNVLRKFELRNNYRPDRNYFLNPRLLNEVKEFLNSNSGSADAVYIYEVLHPRQVVNLTRELRLEVKDKILTVLEIFAEHAGSREAKLQIEMAEISHQLPIVKEWIRKAKLGELPGFMGPGEYATETYYNHMRRRLTKIKRELNELRVRRGRERGLRTSKGFPQVAISGYANAGKTTLFNALTGLRKPVGPEMFTTVSPKVGAANVNGLRVMFVDTVGFVRDLPHEVIEAFYATLEEISHSDFTILMIDSSEALDVIRGKMEASLDILTRVGYFGKPLVVALNKTDLCGDVRAVEEMVRDYLAARYLWEWRVVRVSALRGEGLEELRQTVHELLTYRTVERTYIRLH